ncbi:hypothetical protein VCRA2114E365_150045 [Vibrio crassostreae]|nr:hypothetical protein VCRA2115O371_130075 [Vibrio crassostreae]CAK1759862.1 hypothetical protein VCRA2113O351_140046 [Vibrio crassostreae]CAK1763824.1 hypothetical protein VCRA2117O376_140044 [Vibrio crassostreae]CAK1767582.1 hypothetical protein VCRA2114O369_140075 [Vibrio crassostreae]CAK1768484.1 hypothetical protein VCRA2113O362_140076 [Vibrio crassostreae]
MSIISTRKVNVISFSTKKFKRIGREIAGFVASHENASIVRVASVIAPETFNIDKH